MEWTYKTTGGFRIHPLYFFLAQLPKERSHGVTLHEYVCVSVFLTQRLNPVSTKFDKDKKKSLLISHRVCKGKQLCRRKSYQEVLLKD